jgi:hypothetical protein
MTEPTWMKAGLDAARDTTPVPNGRASPQPAPRPAPEADLIVLSSVSPEPVAWLWRHWLPLGMLAVLDGDPGLGKSTLTLDLAARITRGWLMPPGGGEPETDPRSVLLLSAEDNPANTIRPRLDAAGADVSRVHYLAAVREGDTRRPPVLPWDLELVADHARAHAVALVVADPFSAFLASEFDAHKDQDIRRCLHLIAEFAERLGVCFLLVRHLNKLSGGPALYRGGGSIAITGAGRSSLIVGRDPDEPARHVLAMNKSNLGPTPRALAYRIEQATPDVTRIEWEGECDLRAADILWHERGREPGRPDEQAQEAESFLAGILAKGPVAVKDIEGDTKAAGLCWRTVNKAKVKLKVCSFKELSRWYWRLPSCDS